jgi:hypothetical protein
MDNEKIDFLIDCKIAVNGVFLGCFDGNNNVA